MESAQGSNCPDFSIPSSLPDLTSYHGEHTASSSARVTPAQQLELLLMLVVLQLLADHIDDGLRQQQQRPGRVRAWGRPEAGAIAEAEPAPAGTGRRRRRRSGGVTP